MKTSKGAEYVERMKSVVDRKRKRVLPYLNDKEFKKKGWR